MFMRKGWGRSSAGKRSLKDRIGSFIADRSGNFGLMFALATVPVLMTIGCSFDYVQALNTHHRMQSALDAALVAAVKSVGTKDSAALKAEIGKWLEAESVQKGYYVLNTNGIAIDSTNATIKASVSATVSTTFLKVAGINSFPVAVSSAVAGGETITKTAFSMYLVLDRSGSMDEDTDSTYTTTCYTNDRWKTGAYTCTEKYKKIEALKLAVGSLMGQLSIADPDMKYVRTGAVSYNDNMQTPTPLEWGESGAQAYVTNLTPSGRTDSSDAMATAYDALRKSTGSKSEDRIHYAKNGLKPNKYIVFMTDGANNINDADESTMSTCDKARTKGIRIYTVAFMAPPEGQALLRYCATSSEDYFPAESTAQLVEAFKTIGESSSKNLIRLTQ